MVLRIPHTVDDRSLLEDEPFKSHFALRRPTKEGRGKGRSPFYSNLEKAMRETDGGLDAATAWLQTVLKSRADINSRNIDAFIEFFWLLGHETNRHRIESRLTQLCKDNGYETYCALSASIKMPWPRRQDEAYDADLEDNNLRTDISGRTVMSTSAPPPSDNHSATVAVPTLSNRKRQKTRHSKKRKAKNIEPSVNNILDFPPLVARNQPESPMFSCIDSDSLTPLPSDYEDSPPIPQLSLFAVPLRANPTRSASNRQRLADIMSKETSYQTYGIHDDAFNSFTTTMPMQSAPDFKLMEIADKDGSRKCRTAVVEHTSLSGSMQNTLTVFQTVTPPANTVPAPVQPTLQQKRPSRKNRTARPKPTTQRVRLPRKTSISRPTKKQKTDRGVSGHSGQHARLILEASWAGVDISHTTGTGEAPASGQAKMTRSRMKPKTSTPITPSLLLSQRTQRKRKRGETATVSTPLKIVIPPMQRTVVPLPSKRTKHSKKSNGTPIQAPAVPPNVLGADASVVQQIIRHSATGALETLCCSTEAVDEWDLEYPSAQLAYPDSESDDYVAHTEQVDQLFHIPKLPLPSYPPIWSESRQEVCEAFDKFRSYQGGVYFRKDRVEGYLLGGFSARRDIFHNGGKLIISHGGGKAESLRKTDGHLQTFEASDQLEADKSVRALLRTHNQRQPVALLIDDKYALFPFDLASKGCAYAVLGWYYIAHAWAEYQSATNSQGRVVRYKFAFQWADGQGEPWWNYATGIEPASDDVTDDAIDTVQEECSCCKRPSPQVYEQGWMCLKPECKSFWTLRNKTHVPENLSYATSFLQPVTGFNEHVMDIRPPLPVQPDEITGSTTSWHFCKGWHCPSCGRLSSRFKWEHWECRTCGNVYSIPAKLWSPMQFRFQAHAKTFDRHHIEPGSGIICARYRIFACEKSFANHIMLILPHNRGRIHMLLAPNLASANADNILQEYQEQAISGQLKFRRWPLRAHKCRGTLLTNYFSQNTGEPYQYVGGTDNTVPWDTAPSAVVHALDLIKLRMQQAGVDCQANFNEVLSAAYMERQKMAFHSDSERGLGPVVASLSLGASAYMYFRLHSKFVSPELAPGSSRDVLQLYLRHGDVLVMEGADIQKFYEHTVVPTNFRIAATARSIGNGHH